MRDDRCSIADQLLTRRNNDFIGGDEIAVLLVEMEPTVRLELTTC